MGHGVFHGFFCTCSLKPIIEKHVVWIQDMMSLSMRFCRSLSDPHGDEKSSDRCEPVLHQSESGFQLVGAAIIPSWKMMEFVNGKDDIPFHPIYKMKDKSHVLNHQPANSWHSNLTATCGEPSPSATVTRVFQIVANKYHPQPPPFGKEWKSCVFLPVLYGINYP